MLRDSAVVLPGTGHFFLGPVGSTKPTLAQIVAFADGTADEVQTLTLGAASAGTITITFDGKTTTAIAYNATAAAVQAALEALSNIAVGDVTVTGGPLPALITLTFGGVYADVNVPAITVTPTGLTGGTATVATTTSGGITGLTDLGHTDLDEVLAFGSEGGETEVKGSWQNKALREILTSAAIDYLVVKSLQLKDNDVLSLYYGGGDATVVDEFSLPDSPTVQERSLLVVMLDSGGPVGLWVPRAGVRREAEIGVTTDNFTTIPLRMTYLSASGLRRATWIAAGLGAAA